MRRLKVSLISFIALFAIGSGFAATQSDDDINISSPVQEDLYAAADSILVNAPIEGDFITAGRSLKINATIEGDALLVGEEIFIDATVQDDVRAAGRKVIIKSSVDGHLIAVGETIELERQSKVVDWAWLAGRSITVAGDIGDDVRLAGQTVTIDGTIQGDAEIYAQTVTLTSNAKIHGDITVHAPIEPEISGDAIVEGSYTFDQTEKYEEDFASNMLGGPFGLNMLSGIFGLLVAMVTMLTLFFIFPSFFRSTSENLQNKPLQSAGFGLLTLLVIPLVAIVLMITVFGLGLGLLVFPVYALLLVGGSVAGYVFLAGFGLKRLYPDRNLTVGYWFVAMLVAIVAMHLLQWVPVLGGLASFILFLTGFGALQMTLWQRYVNR